MTKGGVMRLLLQVGTMIIIDKDFTKDSEKYKSKVIDAGNDYVMIDYPTEIETGKTIFFMDGTQLLVSFTDKLKMSYVFSTEVSGRKLQGVPMLRLVYRGDSELIKIQRREFVRVETAIDVAVEKDKEYVRLIAEDISAGGIAINITKTKLIQREDVLSLLIVLPFANREMKYIKVKGQVVRIWEDRGEIIASIIFLVIDSLDRQRIVRFCFERQLQMRNEI